MSDVMFELDGAPSPLAKHCAPDNAGIALPRGFCAIPVATDIRGARHIDIAENGDVFVARENRGNPVELGGVTVLRDTDEDGRAETREDWGVNGGNDVLIAGDFVYQALDDAVVRYRLPPGSMTPAGPPDTVVAALPDDLNHAAKSIALGRDGSLYVSIGAPGNACMEESRIPGSPGMDPCPLLERRGGIWRFDSDSLGQTQADGARFATGLRNVMALRTHPETGGLYAVMHGRDQLHDLWPELYTKEESAELPSEEFVRVTEGADFGWPYCYHDPRTDRKVLAPEYGGDGTDVGRCASKQQPLIGFPAHWAPNDMEFYTGDQFPSYFHGGAFIAFHGSWNRAPLTPEGSNGVFVPFEDGGPIEHEWSVFADGFQDEGIFGDDTTRPVGVAAGPDGSLYVADSTKGRIWRIVYSGEE